MKRRLSILGSTGSIGTQALEVVDNLSAELQVVILTAKSNVSLLAEQARKYSPEMVALADETRLPELRRLLADPDITVAGGRSGLLEAASRSDVDLCLNGLVGVAGMEPTIAALEAGTDVALSNKESLVMAGDHITGLLQESNVQLFPVDSEHSAIWQCLTGEDLSQVRRLILTGSGGPFRTWTREQMEKVTVREALQHPNWDMGPKITVDSATMMNKGLEVIEARWLFGLGPDRIDIVVHPQSIIHSMVEFVDSSVKAQLGVPDMKVPIQYALTYPDHQPAEWPRLDLAEIGQLTFEPPDPGKFPCIALAFEALERGGSAPAVLNLANDRAVAAFLSEQIGYTTIPRILEQALAAHPYVAHPTLADIASLTEWTDRYFQEELGWEAGR